MRMTDEEMMIWRARMAWARNNGGEVVRFLMPQRLKIWRETDVPAYDDCLEIGEVKRSDCGKFFTITWKNYKITVDQSWNRA